MAGLVVLHVCDDEADIPRALSAAELITTQQPMRVQIIVNGSAVAGLTGSGRPPGSRDGVRVSDGVTMSACERALAGAGLTAADLHPGVHTVASAVIALAQAQHEGAAYIRM